MEYEDELRRQRKLLDAVLKPRIRVERTGLSTFFIFAVIKSSTVEGTFLVFGCANSREKSTQPHHTNPGI